MKTQIEIVERIAHIKEHGNDLFGFEREALITCLDYETVKAQGWFSEDPGLEGWPSTTPLEEIKHYMPFALGKAMDHRGLSASRSVCKMQGWVWAQGDYDKVDWENYTNYGAPILKQICELYGIEAPDDEGFKHMAQGDKCFPDCENGCG